MAKQRYSHQFKHEAVKQVTEEGRPKAEVARNLGVANQTLANWIRQLAPPAPPDSSSSDPAEIRRLREENRQLRMEREILKKATAFFANPTQ